MSTQPAKFIRSDTHSLSPPWLPSHAAVGILLLAASQVSAQESAVQAARPENWRSMRPAVEAVRPLPPATDLVALLDSPIYAEREQATHLLTLHGTEAVLLLQEAARSDKPEVAIRAINALEGLWLRALRRQDLAALDAATKAFDELMIDEDPLLFDRVHAIFEAHRPVIHEYSVNQVLRLGGTIKFREHMHAVNDDGTLRKEVEYVIVGRDWTGGLDGLRHIRRLKPRQAVYFIRGTDLPGDAADIAAKFASKPPGIRAVSRGASHLGVSSSPRQALVDDGCPIGIVEPGSSAAKAGMKQSDVIKKFNNIEIKGFDHLVKEIAAIEPGTTVPATVLRNGETIELKVTLEEWE